MTFLRLLVGEKVTFDHDHLNCQKTVATMTKKVANQRQMRLSSSSVAFTYLRSSEIISVMRDVVLLVCPDPTHVMRINTKCMAAHSNRFSVAVALKATGVSIKDIAFRLCWKPELVQHHIQECPQMVDDLTSHTIDGAPCIHIS